MYNLLPVVFWHCHPYIPLHFFQNVFYTCCVPLQDLGNYVTHNVTWYSTSAMASNACTVLETQASTKSNCHGTKILIVKGTAHARLKEIRAKVTVIALASFDVGRLIKSLKEKES